MIRVILVLITRANVLLNGNACRGNACKGDVDGYSCHNDCKSIGINRNMAQTCLP